MRLLEGKNAIVTGCNRGIGRAVLDCFAEHGANVFACVRNVTEEFKAHMEELSEKHSVEMMPMTFDLCDEEAMKKAVGEMRKSKRPIDILVNNAGKITPDVMFQMTPIDNMRDIFEVNFFAQMRFTQYISRLMQRNGKGSIVNLASIAGLDGAPGQLEYVSTKAAIVGATRTLAREFGLDNIRVNAVAPGIIDTDMGNEMDSDYARGIIQRSSLGRKGKPEEIAQTILFLASDLSSYVTGQVIRADGGVKIGNRDIG